MEFSFEKININKISVAFTWDDNHERHWEMIAPLFLANNLFCTFYIVLGDKEFLPAYMEKYIDLSRKGFEIGSHGLSHHYMSRISKSDALIEFTSSIEQIISHFQKYPLTFAFPYHDYNKRLLTQARSFHLETRNTLSNSVRFDIKKNTSLNELKEALLSAIKRKKNLILAGHSIITDEEYLNGNFNDGYEPVRLGVLSDFLLLTKDYTSNAEVVTFIQAALKEYIKKHVLIRQNICQFNQDTLQKLNKVGIDSTVLQSLL